MLSGYKTYLVAALLAVLSAAEYLGYVAPETARQLEALLLAGGFAALRAGVAKK